MENYNDRTASAPSTKSTRFRQLRLLLWKNYTLQKRRPVATAFEIGLPTLFFLLLLVIRRITDHGDNLQCTDIMATNFGNYSGCFYQPLTPAYVTSDAMNNCSMWFVDYAPNTTDANRIIGNLNNTFQPQPTIPVQYEGFGTEQQVIDDLLLKADITPTCRVGIVFDNLDLSTKTVSYSLRFDSRPGGVIEKDQGEDSDSWFTSQAFPFFQPQGPRDPRNSFVDPAPGYMANGFSKVQTALDWAIARIATNDSAVVETLYNNMQMERMPFPQYKKDSFVYALQFGMPLLLMLSLLFSALSIVRNLVYEKEKRLKESMKMMGLKNWIHWLAWFIEYFLFLMISMIIICGILGGGKIIPNSDMSLIFVFLMMFAIVTISFCFLMSVFFSKAQTGAAVAGILWFCSYVPYFFISTRFDTLSANTKTSSCLLSTTCMALGANVLATMEANGQGVRWSNFAKPPSVDDNFAFGSVMAMFVFDTCFYLFLAWYIEAVFPGEFGIARKWYFPFTKAYWCGDSRKSEKDSLLGLKDDEHTIDRNNFEREPTDRRAGIDIVNLRKVFDSKVAVASTSLKLYEGQITALLGHNGAGKTTTMSMLTGLFSPTSGTAYVDGYDIRSNINAAQQSMGICPQHDVLFDTLTVEEHLWFFCKLKGVADKEVPKHINGMVQDLEIVDKRHTASKDLSGGMKRKLSCAIALVGGSKVVILDEPTSGMDPSARRATWDLLAKHKEGRTVLLSTHFMDEADLLGDRIAIMSDGVVRCCGSSMFLKRRFGEGYHVTIAKGAGADSNKIANFVTSMIPDSRVELDVGAELTFILPRGAVAKFEDLFNQLETRKSEFGIESYGASITTMEEVFLKVGEGTAGAAEERVDIQARLEKRKMNKKPRHLQDSHGDTEALLGADNVRLQSGFQLKRQQFFAMLVKRFYHSSRDKYAIVSQLLMPMLFTIIAMILIKTFPPGTDSDARQLTNLADNYGYNRVMYLSGVPSQGVNGTNNTDLLASSVPTVLGRYGQNQDFVKADFDLPLYAVDIAGTTPPDVARFNREVLVGLNFFENATYLGALVFFNGQAYHSAAESVNLFSNVVLQSFAPDWSISVSNYPLPRTAIEQAKDQQDSQMGFTISFNILFGMAFLASSFVLFLVAERTNKAKHIQFVSGVDVFSYWCSSFLWDYINYLVPTFTIIILFPIFGVDEYSGQRAGYVLLLFLLYGFAVIPLMHLASFLFMSASIAYTRLTMFNIATGLGTLLTISILSILDPDTAENLKSAFLFLPNYCFGQGLSDIYTNYQFLNLLEPIVKSHGYSLDQICDLDPDMISKFLAEAGSTIDITCNTNYLGMRSPGIGKYIVGLILQGIIFFFFVILAEYQVFDRLRGKLFPLSSVSSQGDTDSDVAKERERVRSQIQTLQLNKKGTRGNELESSTDEADIVLIEGLTKIYRTGSFGCGKEKQAVDNLTVGIPRSECFGLLGVNGAGKTTTFRMLTGDLEMTRGVAYMDGYNTATEKTQVRQRIGYCPQFDGLIDLLTGREMLTMYARLRGVPEFVLKGVVEDLIESLMLEKHADKYTKTYSGGNKRKLSTAVALVGSPPIVFLDEPTTGMDPGARRFLWDSLINARREGRSIVLTSHSMEECEALCTRLAIMVNGQFQCLGSPQHLKNKFGKGIAVTVKLQEANRTEELRSYVARTFPQTTIKEEHQGMVKFIINGNVAWASVFGLMERAKSQFNIEDYSVCQPTLEQIFLDFAKHQIEEEHL